MAVFKFGDAVKAQEAEGSAKGKKRKGRKSRKGLSIVIMIIAVAICLLVMLVGFITDWMWFKDLGYTSVFWKKLVTELEIGIPTFLIVTLLARFYLRTLKKGYFKKIESHEIPNERKINARSWLISIVFGVLMGLYASTGTWLTYLKSANATNFGLKDPHRLNQIVLVGIIGLVIVTVLYYTYLLGVRTPDIFVHDEEEPPQPEEFVEPEEDVDPWVLKEEGKDIPFDQSLMGKLFKKGKKVVQDNVDENGRLKRRKKPEVNNSNLEQLLEIASGKLTVLGIIFYLMLGVDFFLRQFGEEMSSSLTHHVDGFVAYHAHYPCLQCALTAMFEVFDVREHFDERLLQHVASHLGIGYIAHGHRHSRACEATIQLLLSLAVALMDACE